VYHTQERGGGGERGGACVCVPYRRERQREGGSVCVCVTQVMDDVRFLELLCSLGLDI
jgi:hypothetical protein